MLALIRELLLRSDGWPRGPRQLAWLGGGLWHGLPTDLPPAQAERRARRSLALLDRAWASEAWTRAPRRALVRALADQGRLDEATDEARALCEVPHAPGAGSWWLAVHELESGRPSHAVAPARRALVAAADAAGLVVDAAALLALALHRDGHDDEARRVARVGLEALEALQPGALRQEREPSTQGLLWLTAARTAPAASEERVQAYRCALRVSVPSHRPVLTLGLARTLHAMGDHAEAAAILEGAGDLSSSRWLGHLYVEHLGRPQDAVSVLERAVTLPVTALAPPRERVALNLDLAGAALAAREPARAALAARQVLTLGDAATPEQLTRTERVLGLALEAVGDLEGAVQALQSALGRCRDACVQFGGDAVPEALEVQVTADLRRVLAAHSSAGAGSSGTTGALSGKVADGTSR